MALPKIGIKPYELPFELHYSIYMQNGEFVNRHNRQVSPTLPASQSPRRQLAIPFLNIAPNTTIDRDGGKS
jgi:hypothetical protein